MEEEKSTQNAANEAQDDSSSSPTGPTGRSSMESSQSLVLFSAPLIQKVDRLTATYVGTRRLRPSEKWIRVKKNGKKNKTKTILGNVVFKTTDPETGQERRMTNSEKKQWKKQRRELFKQEQQQAAGAQPLPSETTTATTEVEVSSQPSSILPTTTTNLASSNICRMDEKSLDGPPTSDNQHQQDQLDVDMDTGTDLTNVTKTESTQQSRILPKLDGKDDSNQSNDVGDDDENRRYEFEVDQTKLAEELADLRGEREDNPPMAVAPPLARLFLPDRHDQLDAQLDDELARSWAKDLKESMKSAETSRKSEQGIRPLPYHLVPEVWTRMRPASLVGQEASATSTNNDTRESNSNTNCRIIETGTNDNDWALVSIRPHADCPMTNAILQVLHTGTTELHISCGTKFGCDYLLYDGPRNERHAFAGLRIVPHHNTSTSPPPPSSSAYSLAGYVRCLNTAGKLALLATAVPNEHDKQRYRVAIVDLALQKTSESTSKRRMKTMDERMKKLAKGS